MAINDNNVVSDPFWLNIGAEEVYNSTQSRKDAVQRLQAAIAWVFTIYTATTVGSVAFGKNDWSIWALLLLGFSFVLLTRAYWLATVAGFPVPESFYPSEPDSVREAFDKALKNNNRRFKKAVAITSIGVLFYSTGLLVQFASPVYKAYFGQTTLCATLGATSIKCKDDKSIILRISSRKNSWNKVLLLHDTIINKKKSVDTIILKSCKCGKENCVFADSTSVAVLKFSDPAKSHLYAVISRTDTLLNGKLVQTFRLKYSIY